MDGKVTEMYLIDNGFEQWKPIAKIGVEQYSKRTDKFYMEYIMNAGIVSCYHNLFVIGELPYSLNSRGYGAICVTVEELECVMNDFITGKIHG